MADSEATAEIETSLAAAPLWKKAGQALVSTIIVVGIFVGVFPRIANYSEVWVTIRSLTWPESTSLALVAIWNLATYWFVLVAALPGLRLREAAVVNQASTAVSNTLPGGGAIGVGVTVTMLNSWGFPLPAIARSTLVTGVWNNFVKLGMPVVALCLLVFEGDISASRLGVAAIGLGTLLATLVMFRMVLKSEQLARKIGNGLGRLSNKVLRLLHCTAVQGWGDRAAAFRRDTIGLLRHRWLQLTLATAVSHLSLYVILLLTLRFVGVGQRQLGWIQVLAAFSFVRLISALPVTPGGAGVVELGYAATLTIGLEETVRARVVAAILMFRAITYALPIPLGAVSYVAWRRNRTWRLSESERMAMTGDAYVVADAA